MGADLFINSLFEPNQARCRSQFAEAIAQRDSLPEGSSMYQEAQARAEEFFDRMYSQGYFRDPYNSWDLLGKFGLSWRNDILPMLDSKNYLAVEGTKRLLALLDEREICFEDQVSILDATDQQDFRSRYIEFRQFLNQAVALGEPIECSL